MIELIPPTIERVVDITEAVRESRRELQPWMPWAKPDYSVSDAGHWITEMAPTGHEFLVLDESGNYLGNVGLNSLRPENRIANLGYWIRSSATGRGYATAAVQELVAWARQHTDLNRLEIVVAVGNTPSRRVAAKAGAQYEGIARARLLLHGEFHDTAMYSFTN